jgi:hypothetical protein
MGRLVRGGVTLQPAGDVAGATEGVTMPPLTPRFACPVCGHTYSRVTHVQYPEDPGGVVSIWRRRQCLACQARYTTMGTERIVGAPTVTLTIEIIPPAST